MCLREIQECLIRILYYKNQCNDQFQITIEKYTVNKFYKAVFECNLQISKRTPLSTDCNEK